MSTENKPAVKQATIKQLLNSDSIKTQIAAALPKHMTPERMIRVATTALLRTPKLEQCDQASFFKALLDLSAWGLEPDGRRAHLIPFRNNRLNIMECQLILDYKGLVELARRSGEVATIHADVVCKNDVFEYGFGSDQKLIHKPNLIDRGETLGAYAHVRLKDGTEQFEVLSMKEIDSVRKRSRAANDGPWVTDFNEMAKKTAFRRLSKWLPISSEMADAFEADADTIRSEREISATERPAAPVPALLREEAADVAKMPAPAKKKAQPEPEPAIIEAEQPEPERQQASEPEPPLEEQPEISWGNEPPAQTEPEPEPPTEKPAKTPINWKETVIHFGKETKGKRLGELPQANLSWFQKTWLMEARKTQPGDLSDEDKALIAALEASLQPKNLGA